MASSWRKARTTPQEGLALGSALSHKAAVTIVFLVVTLTRELVERTTAAEELTPAPGTPRHIAAEMVEPARAHAAVAAPLATVRTGSSTPPEGKEIEGHAKDSQG